MTTPEPDHSVGACGRRFVVVTLDVPFGAGSMFHVDDDEAIAGALADDLRDAEWAVLGISVYGLGKDDDGDQ